jgi:hypothetical protein
LRSSHFEQAIVFKKRLDNQDSWATGNELIKATLCAKLNHFKRIFQWLTGQLGSSSMRVRGHAE